jgi:putative ABC transport system ATP-binding protein
MTTSSTPAVQLISLVKSYGQGASLVPVLKDLSMTVQRGEFVAIMGPSGSGKTSLLNVMGGLDMPDAGEVLIDGQALHRMTTAERADWRASRVGFIFQFYNLIPVLSALDNVALPLSLSKLGATERRERATAALELVGLSHRLRHRPQQLSGGEQQRVAIARAIVAGPSLLLCDEPTGDLDRDSGEQILALLRLLQERRGCSIVMVTHDSHAAGRADRIVRVDKGRLVNASASLAEAQHV